MEVFHFHPEVRTVLSPSFCKWLFQFQGQLTVGKPSFLIGSCPVYCLLTFYSFLCFQLPSHTLNQGIIILHILPSSKIELLQAMLLSFSGIKLSDCIVAYKEEKVPFVSCSILFKQKEENEICYRILKQMLAILLTHVLWCIM